MADSWAAPPDRRIVAQSRVLLELLLHPPQGLDLVCELAEARNPGGVEQVVFEHCELGWVGDAVVIAVLQFQELVHLRAGEFVSVSPVHLGDDRIARSHMPRAAVARHEFGRDHLLSHRHREFFGR